MVANKLVHSAFLVQHHSSESPICNPMLNLSHAQLVTSIRSPSIDRLKLKFVSSGNFNAPIKAALSSFSSGGNYNKNTDQMIPPYNVLITGGSKGIGYALAKEFLKAGDNVFICSRSAERVDCALEKLREETGKQHVWGTKCDIRDSNNVRRLVAFAKQELKYIDIWINNAGSNAYSYKPLVEASDEDLIEVVTTNTLGLMICCREVYKIQIHRFAAYGATKRSVAHLTKSLQAELEMQDVRKVVVHNLSPGMVTTELLMSGATTKQAKFFINILAEPADVVSKYLVPKIRSIPTSGSTKPTYIHFLTGLKAYSQIFLRIAFGVRRNRHIFED
ncbi:unnamed protein product [Cuscuta epithymum]|uniref:Chlorophyll(Ide) b reductase NOL, chloroplastic n=1 Tax=Cuscuta epithymum TaxID=186058 RepID=A0AAV0EY20_9ASTE|nr:unnamed protein product [Cuscuta epithymum]CAH9128147.1 unnamed protein product [Cuscuta epithymum]